MVNKDARYVHVDGQVTQLIPLPVVPLYDLKLAAQLIPCPLNTLRWRLNHHKERFKPVYRREGTGRRVRLMSAVQIRVMRSLMLKGPGLEEVLVPFDMHLPAKVKQIRVPIAEPPAPVETPQPCSESPQP